ncbi:unnamed protein product [Brassica oleracea]|uniref:importin beta-like SAD2 homolog n=1 Tax=Brassica oleracea var. oleracea TaxID=109376 RepID=UPI0006A6D56A|nr:PREDICTED: importin beta-like SAD2 homolog [Brassica oleracea var. oleracea]
MSGNLLLNCPMDLSNLAVIIAAAACSPNPDERKATEQSLDQIKHTPQHLIRVLQIVVDGGCDPAVRQAASIHFKNFIAKHWDPHSGDQSKILPSDKNVVRDQILVYVSQLPPILRVQMGECLKTLIYADFPEQWPHLLDWVKHNLQDQQVYGALFVLRIMSSKYEFKSDEDRAPIYRVVEETFPHLLNIFDKLVQIESPSLEVADHIKLICKIFWSCIYLELPRPLFVPNFFNAWMVLFLNILERPVPLEGQPEDPELRKSWGWWKTKKWVAHILNRLYTRFGDLKLQNPENKAFAQMFQTNYAAKILECHLKLLNVIRIGGYLPDRVINLILQYLSNSIPKNSMYTLLQPHLDVLLFEIIFPLMCFNDDDQVLWDEDPHEYVRKGYDIIEDLYSPRTASMDFVTELVRKRGKDNFPKFIQFIVGIFKRYGEAPLEQKPYRQKDGALLAVGTLCDKLRQTEPYKSELENMLVQHVFPEFSSPAGHLRAKAAWVAGQYANINFSDQTNFSKALHCVISGMRDPELPVRVDSVFALRSFIDACKNLDEIRPVLPQLLDEFFKLMNEVENEDLAFTLETIVYKFGEEISPYALGLCQNLASAFWKCVDTDNGDDEADDTGALAAVGCLRAISTILESISSLPHLYGQIEPYLLPIMRKMLTTDGQDVFEEVLEIVSYITTFSPTISLDMWSLWPLIMEALVDWAIDFFPNILVPLHNYISRGTEHYLTCKQPDYQQSLWSVISSLMANKNIDDSDLEPAPKLLGIVLQTCKGHVDQCVEPYLRITLDRLRGAEKSSFKCLLIEVVANAFYYNAPLTLGILQRLGFATDILTIWLHMLQEKKKNGAHANFKGEHDKKVCILGLTSILSLPAGQLPGEVLPHVFRALLELLVGYKDQLAEAAKAEEEEDEEDGDDDNMDDFETDDEDDEENPDETDESKLRKLAAQAKDFRSYSDDDDEFSEDDYSDEELDSPIDEVDPFILFMDAVTAMQATDSLRFQSLRQTLDPHYEGLANNIAQHTEQRRAEILKEQLEKQASTTVLS